MGEIAMVSSRKTRLEDRAKRGNPGAIAALSLLQHPERLLSTVQVGITTVSIIAGAFGGGELAHQVARHLQFSAIPSGISEFIAMALVVGSISFLSLVFGELVPKSIALNNPERVAVLVAPLLVAIATVTQPLIRLLTVITTSILKLLGITNNGPVPVSEEEFKLMIEEGVQHGVIEQQESEMLKGIFRFDDRKAQSIMTHRQQLVWVNLQETTADNRIKILSSKFTKFLVCDGDLDQLKGLLSIKDYINALESTPTPAIEPLVTPVIFIPENMTGIKILEKFRQQKRYVGVVLNEHGAIEGMITLHDLIESIVGDLPEIYDTDPVPVVQRDDGSWLVEGSLLLDELKDTLAIDAFDNDDRSYSTLGGLMMDQLDKIPTEGDRFTAWGYRFEVVDMDGRRVDKVLIQQETSSNSNQEEQSE